ncbi:MAG: hypothetical protein FWC65_01450 [Treponema sp.]|nr:hypothetical protein [Treponema sp.]
MLITGLFFFALGVVTSIRAHIGYAPWSVFHVGLADTIGWSIGATSIMVGMVIVMFAALLREKLGLGTILNMVVIGLFIDVIFPFIPLWRNFPAGIMMLFAGIFSISVGTYCYMRAGFGPGPRDSLMVALNRKTRLPIGLCRSTLELAVTIAGFLLGGMVGIGTIIFVVAIGFSIQMTFKLFKFDAKAVKHETLRETYVMLKNAIFRQGSAH